MLSTVAAVGSKGFFSVELEAGQLKHPDLGQRVRVQPPGQGIEQGRPDIARHRHSFAGPADQLAGEGGDRGFAVGAGHGQHFGVVAARGLQAAQRLGKQAQFTGHPQAQCARRLQNGGNVGRCESRALEHRPHVTAFNQRGIERAADKAGRRHVPLQGGQLRRRSTRVRHRHLRPAARAPARHGQAGRAQAQDQNVLVLQAVHLSFRVDRPTRHSSMVMIQNRTTTCVSFQPLFSKWWCSGAIFRMRRPSP